MNREIAEVVRDADRAVADAAAVMAPGSMPGSSAAKCLEKHLAQPLDDVKHWEKRLRDWSLENASGWGRREIDYCPHDNAIPKLAPLGLAHGSRQHSGECARSLGRLRG